MGEIKTAIKSLADVVKKYLEEMCIKENIQLDKCVMRSGMVYFKIIRKDKSGFNIIVEHEINVHDVNITRIKKRIRQLLNKEPMDEKECVPENCGCYSLETKDGKPKHICTITDPATRKKSISECSQIKYRNRP